MWAIMASPANKPHLLDKKHFYCLCCQHGAPRVAFKLPYLQDRHPCFRSPHSSARKNSHFLVLTLTFKGSRSNSHIHEASHTLLCWFPVPSLKQGLSHNREHFPQPDRVWPVPALNSPRGFVPGSRHLPLTLLAPENDALLADQNCWQTESSTNQMGRGRVVADTWTLLWNCLFNCHWEIKHSSGTPSDP